MAISVEDRPATASRKPLDHRDVAVPKMMLLIAIPLMILGLCMVWRITRYAVTPNEKLCTKEYVVKPGDTWYGLAKTYGDPEKTIWFSAGASATLSRNGQTPNTILDQPLQVGDTVTLYCGGPPPSNVIKPDASG